MSAFSSSARLGRAWLGLMVLCAAVPAHADLAEVKKAGVLRVLAVVVPSEPEFIADGPGQAPGFDREVLRGFAALHGLKIELQPLSSWDALVPALVQKRGDVIAGRFTATDERRKLIAFSAEVFPTRVVVVSRAPAPRIDTLAALRATRVGAVKGSSLVGSLLAAGVPPDKLDAALPSGGSLEALRSGRVEAVAMELAEAIVAQRRDPQLQLGLFVGVTASYAFGVRKDDADLRRALDDYLTGLRLSPTWSRLVAKYFGASAPEILRRARED
jgi:ABC-type amino acid transport substrate-binding protein